jgi:predicted S18 family serine protease
MKMLMMAAAACTVLAGCATSSTEGSAPARASQVAQAEDDTYVPTGSNIPRKKGQGTVMVSTMSAVELESARMDPGKAPELPPGQ